MISRLTRILMALVTAFVFTGQMEAAAQHCARLAKAEAAKAAAIVAAADAAPPCHETTAAAAHVHAATSHDHSAPDHSGHGANHSKAPPHCECIAALNGWIDFDGAVSSTHVEAYAWLTPAETGFASAMPDPDLRPPRA